MKHPRVDAKGRITIPAEVRKKLHLRPGDKVAFINEGEKTILSNASLAPLSQIQEQMRGAAEKAGVSKEDDVVKMTKDVGKARERT